MLFFNPYMVLFCIKKGETSYIKNIPIISFLEETECDNSILSELAKFYIVPPFFNFKLHPLPSHLPLHLLIY